MTDHDPMAAIDAATPPPDPTQEREDALRQVARAARTAERAQDALRDAARTARQQGVPITEIADAADVTRPTIYRWTNDLGLGSEKGSPLHVRETIDHGLTILSAHGDTQAGRYIGRGSVMGAIAAWETGLKNVGTSNLDEDERAIISQVSLVVGLAKNHKARTGTYPKTVSF